MLHRSLASFAKWFLEQSFGSIRLPHHPVLLVQAATDDEKISGASISSLLVFREGEYQVELFSGLPSPNGVMFPEHRHPDVDSIEVFLSGDIAFTVNGKRVRSDEHIAQGKLAGEKVFVRSKDWHGARVGPGGGAFLSIQKWRNGVEPTSVAHNWIGPSHLSVSNG